MSKNKARLCSPTTNYGVIDSIAIDIANSDIPTTNPGISMVLIKSKIAIAIKVDILRGMVKKMKRSSCTRKKTLEM